MQQGGFNSRVQRIRERRPRAEEYLMGHSVAQNLPQLVVEPMHGALDLPAFNVEEAAVNGQVLAHESGARFFVL
jgi:hypothetical protein